MTNQKPDILKAIAPAMKVDAKHKGQTAHALGRGLHLWLKHDQGTYTLAMSRENTVPSKTEQSVVAAAFGIPLGTEFVATTAHHNGHTWNRIWYRWPAEQPGQVEQPALMEVSGGGDSYY